MRLDVYLNENNMCESRKKASDCIKEGLVRVNGRVVIKPAFDVSEGDTVEIVGDTCPYVGRGGYKLEGALKMFGVDVSGAVCIDVGSSTGGFTDCLLQHGASKVFAVDSGKDQLHERLRSDPRVVCMESCNARGLTPADIGQLCDVAVMDVSFISQTLLHEGVASVLKDGGLFISLIKPQFEVGKSGIGKNGIVKDEKIRRSACTKVVEKALEYGFVNVGIIDSPIAGGDGNREYLALFRLEKQKGGD